MDKLLRRYLNDDGFKAVAVVFGNKRVILENDIHVDYEHEVIIYPMKNCTRIIPFGAISYLDLLEKMTSLLIISKKSNRMNKRLTHHL